MTIDDFPVERGHIAIFARAIGDPNPVYWDGAAAERSEVGGIIAPPTFVEAGQHFDPTFAYRPRIGEPWFGSAAEPSSGPPPNSTDGTSFHAETHFEYHRVIRPGDVLHTVSGPSRSWTKHGRRGGTLTFVERTTHYLDQADHEVVTARVVAVTTERVVDNGSSREAPPATSPRPDLVVGDSVARVIVDNLTRAQILQYAGASGDFSPQHTDEVYAVNVGGYPTVFAHGMLTMGMTGRLLTDWLGDGRLSRYGMRFLAQVWPGDTLTAHATMTAASLDQVEVDVSVDNERGERVATGYATADRR